MAKAVVITKYEASDGSLHDTEWEVDQHNLRMKKQIVREDVAEALRNAVEKHHFTALNETITPYNGHVWHDYRREREEFLDELASLIIDKFDDLKAAIEGAK